MEASSHPLQEHPGLAASATKRSRRNNRFIPFAAVGVALILWEVSTSAFLGNANPFIPSFSRVVIKGFQLFSSGEIFSHVGASLFRILLGFAIGSLIGAPLGLLMGTIKPIREALDPFVQFFRFIPSICWLTPAVIWFGIGET